MSTTRKRKQTVHTEADGLTRRDLLRRSGTLAALAAAQSLAPFALSGCGTRAGREPTVKVGILHSQTGTMAISETSLRDMELMAIEEINASGGVLGRQIEPIVEDTRSRNEQFARKARKLLLEDSVVAVFGCWTSSSRKEVLPQFVEHNGLLFYPVQYEGNESCPNVIYGGAVPNQQILPSIDWLLSAEGGSKQRFFLVGSDYVFPRTANLIIKKYLESKSLSIVGEIYARLRQQQFEPVVSSIQKADADVVISTINGDSNIHFYSELSRQKITADKLPVVATSVGEDELRSLLPEQVQGHYAAWNYFQSIPTDINRQFVERFRRDHGLDRVTDDPMEAAYSQVYVWKLAAEKADSFDTSAIQQAFRAGDGIAWEAPGGRIKVDPKTQHTYRTFRLGRIRDDRQFDVVVEAPSWTAPDPYPAVAFPGWSCDWTKDGIVKGSPVDIGS